MKFEVDIEKLIDNSISITQYFLCQMIYLQESKLLNFYLEQFGTFSSKADFDNLLKSEYIGIHDEKRGYVFSNFYTTHKFVQDFIEKEKRSKLENSLVEDWIDIWYNLFPRGVKSGGYLVRSDRNGCLTKMKKFIKANPDFTREIILKATSNYVDYMRMRNYGYMSLAHYFIYKDGMSVLAGQCEAILEKIQDGKEVDLSLNQYKISTEAVAEDEGDIFGGSMDRL